MGQNFRRSKIQRNLRWNFIYRTGSKTHFHNQSNLRLCLELVDRLELVLVDEVASERRLLAAVAMHRHRRRRHRRRRLLDGVEAEEPAGERVFKNFRHLEKFCRKKSH